MVMIQENITLKYLDACQYQGHCSPYAPSPVSYRQEQNRHGKWQHLMMRISRAHGNSQTSRARQLFNSCQRIYETTYPREEAQMQNAQASKEVKPSLLAPCLNSSMWQSTGKIHLRYRRFEKMQKFAFVGAQRCSQELAILPAHCSSGKGSQTFSPNKHSVWTSASVSNTTHHYGVVPCAWRKVATDFGLPCLQHRGYEKSCTPHELPVNIPCIGVFWEPVKRANTKTLTWGSKDSS